VTGPGGSGRRSGGFVENQAIESVAVKALRLWSAAGWRRAGVVLAAGAFLFLSGVQSWPDFIQGMRPVNQQDELYRYVAQELDEPSLCEEIPWSAESPGGFFIAPSYERSNCYAFIAGRTKNPGLCWKVKRLGAFRLLSQQLSMWSCLADARRGMNAGVGVNPDELATFFTRLGYEADTLDQEGITPPLVSVRDFYRQLANRPDIVAHVEKAIGKSGSLAHGDANAAYLADLAALVTETPGWCARIPEDLPLAAPRARFRDWCVFTLASNTRNPALCLLIPVSADSINPTLLLKTQCNYQTRAPHPMGRYGPEVPDTDDRTRALIAMLHYEIPRAKDLPRGAVYGAFERFLQELNRGNDARHAAARQRFITRVRALHGRH
jgi:hypothetical protein